MTLAAGDGSGRSQGAPHQALFLVLAALPPAIAVGALMSPLAGLIVGAMALVVATRPLEPVTAFALLAATASFVNNEGGRLTRDLSIVSLVGLYAAASVLMAWTRGRWRPVGGRFVTWIALFMAWTLICAARGFLAGYPVRNIGLELAALSTFVLAWLAGGLRVSARELRPVKLILILAGLVHVGLGVWSYAVNHIRTGGIWYTPLPGMLAVLSLANALRATRAWTRWAWTVLLGLFMMHQTISFSRGYWFGLLLALPATAIVYAGRGDGAAARWRRVFAVAAAGGLLAMVTTIGTSLTYGWSDIASLIGTRFNSSFQMKNNSESASNIERLLEYATSYRFIRESPIIGHGMGLELRIRNPLIHRISRQWYVHHTYLWLWLKQGAVGVLLLLVILWGAWWNGVRGARSPDPEAAAWALTAAGATLYLSVVDLTTFHLAQVNATTLQALLWGITLALSNPVALKVVWKRRVSAAALPARA